jgi:hypothetical protein
MGTAILFWLEIEHLIGVNEDFNVLRIGNLPIRLLTHLQT